MQAPLEAAHFALDTWLLCSLLSTEPLLLCNSRMHAASAQKVTRACPYPAGLDLTRRATDPPGGRSNPRHPQRKAPGRASLSALRRRHKGTTDMASMEAPGWDGLRGVVADSGIAVWSALSAPTTNEPVLDISLWKLPLIVLLLVFPLAVCRAAKLGLSGSLIVAFVRCLIQLFLLGGILRLLFAHADMIWVAMYITFMMLVASLEAGSRPSMSYMVLLTPLTLLHLWPLALHHLWTPAEAVLCACRACKRTWECV